MSNSIIYVGGYPEENSSKTITAKSGNTYKKHKFKLMSDTGVPKDLTGAKAYVFLANGKNLFLKREMDIEEGGIVAFHFYKEDNIPPGSYLLEIRVSYDEEEHFETFPASSFFSMKIIEDVAKKPSIE